MRKFNRKLNQDVVSNQNSDQTTFETMIPLDLGSSFLSPQNTTVDPRVIWLDNDILPETTLSIIQQINDINYQDSQKEKEYALDGQVYIRPPIKLHVNSPGGCIYSGLGLIGVMQASKTPVHTYTYNTVASMGFLIAVSGDKRFSYPHTTYMYHAGSLQTGGHLLSVKESVEESDRLQRKADTITIANTKISLERLEEIYSKKQDWFFDAEQALVFGCVDEIL